MANLCGTCKHGHETKPGGTKASPGTVWCGQRNLQMGKQRQLPCFVAPGGVRPRHCLDCKRAKLLSQTGEAPRPGNVWCDKRHTEINKQRTMECFE
ncbi:MAG: hypothetical protein IPQ16_02045 [Geobacteraceae bacterium]|nr:hypothetical protein [Geobacteraceae bacterium]